MTLQAGHVDLDEISIVLSTSWLEDPTRELSTEPLEAQERMLQLLPWE